MRTMMASLKQTFKMGREQKMGNAHLRVPFVVEKCKKLPLVNKRGKLNVEIRGLPKTFLYWGDMFHTLVNMPNTRFLLLLLLTYFLLFFAFAIPFYYEGCHNLCIPGVHNFRHAFWFSVQTSMTIGYGGDLTPDPNCTMTNVLVITQSFASLIIAYSLLGVFYARFSRPTRRAQTLVFSKNMVLYEEDGIPVLALRMANIRKHQIIEANVRLLVGLNNTLAEEDERFFHFTPLTVVGGNEIFLGLPCTVKHLISSSSPLYGLSLQEMEQADLEILVLLECVDASTSCKLQARHSYQPSDICKDSRFETIIMRLPNGRRCVDFTKFDVVVPVTAKVVMRPGQFSSSTSLPMPCVRNFGARSHDDGIEQDGKPMRILFPVEFQDSEAELAPDLEVLPQSKKSVTQVPAAEFSCFPNPCFKNCGIPTEILEAWLAFKAGRHREHWSCITDSLDVHCQFCHRRCLMKRSKSTPDFTRRGHLDIASLQSKEEEYEQKVEKAEASAQAWKSLLIELAFKVQQTLQQPSTSADADAGQLTAFAKQCLSHALLSK